MRFRKTNAIIGASIVVSGFFMIYLVIDTMTLPYEDPELQKIELNSLEEKLKSLENDLILNQNTIEQIKDTVKELRKEQTVLKEESKAIRAKGRSSVNKTFASIDKHDYTFAREQPSKCDIQMNDVYEKLEFDNPDGGVWKQGFDIRISPEDREKKLRVFVMPHSHNDPGWIKTYEKYYEDQTRQIFNNMVPKLEVNSKRKFIWAEISYLMLWWNESDLNMRKRFLALLKNNQIEIVTGGWVMNDEANSHYYSIIEQLIGGHEWCNLNLDGYKPNNGWSIDPFGMSPTQAYLLKRMGFDNILIQRTHYSIKKHLSKTQDLEFLWRQLWDHQDSTDMFTHMMPFYSYDIPHTCGPDPKVCCQFDFDRLPGGRASCPWRIPPQRITQSNVKERAETLLDQYRKKGKLYKTNVVLAPLGDDFRYDKSKEWDNQFENYEALMEYINTHPEFNAEISFGTLADYFNAVHEESTKQSGSDVGMFKTLSGDFFNYADRDDHYWSGYYTSRPFYKNMDRVLEGYLRAAEIMYSMMWAEMEYVGTDFPQMADPMMQNIMYARHNLALFQHHDGITGTAKNHVVVDYGNKMLDSITNLQKVMSQAAHYLLSGSKSFYKPKMDTLWFDLDDVRETHHSTPKQTVIHIEHSDSPSKVVIFNSHARTRTEVVTIRVSLPDVRVYKINEVEGDDEEETVESQLSPVFDDEGQVMNTEFDLSFVVQVKGLGLQTYFVKQLKIEEGANTDMDVAKVRIHNSGKHPFQVAPFDVEVFEKGDVFTLQNGYVRGKFDPNGILQSVTTIDDKIETKCQLEFVYYLTRKRGDKSGAYLFLPEGEAMPMKIENPLVRIIDGKVLSYVEVFLPYAKHRILFKSSPGTDGTGFLVENDVDVRKLDNVEVAMRFNTDVQSGEEFFTDLNGFQMIRRKRYSKIPLQANYYPIPSMAYIKDDNSRFTLVTRQPLGGSSLAPGQLEIMQDRRLMQDDNRGLGHGVTDNLVTRHEFFVLVERKQGKCEDEADSMASYPSLTSIAARHSLLNPLYRLLYVADPSIDSLTKRYEPLDKDLACDIHVVNLRTMLKSGMALTPSDNAALIVHRQGFNGCYKPVGMTCSTNGGKLSLEELFPELYSDAVKQMSLSLMYEGMKVEKGFTVSIKPMEVYSFLMRR